MPLYTYRREDGSLFEMRQKFLDDPLTVDPETGQRVVRVMQAAGIIFKGSGFYVNDSKDTSRSSVNTTTAKPSESSTEKAEKATPAPATTTTAAPAASAAAD